MLLRENVYKSLRSDILTCHFAPGDDMREQDLAERYAVSRQPVREALTPRPVRVAREEPVEVVVVLRIDVDAPLEEAGAETQIVSPEKDQVKGWDHDRFGDAFKVDVKLKSANADDYDALLLPGGVMNPDKLRTLPEAVAKTRCRLSARSTRC